MDSNSKESKKSKGDTAYVHEWIYNTSTEQEAERKLVVSKDADDCLAARLYASCVQVLQGICYQVSDPGVSYPAVNQHMFKNELGRLYLFGDSFKNGKLNRILENADELEESIVEILAGIGILLARSECNVLRPVLYFYLRIEVRRMAESSSTTDRQRYGCSFE